MVLHGSSWLFLALRLATQSPGSSWLFLTLLDSWIGNPVHSHGSIFVVVACLQTRSSSSFLVAWRPGALSQILSFVISSMPGTHSTGLSSLCPAHTHGPFFIHSVAGAHSRRSCCFFVNVSILSTILCSALATHAVHWSSILEQPDWSSLVRQLGLHSFVNFVSITPNHNLLQ